MTLLKQLAVIVIGCVIAGGMAVLGVWQLNIYHAQGTEAAASRAAQPPVPLSSVATAGTRIGTGYGLSVTFQGVYDPRLQVLLPLADPGPGRDRDQSGDQRVLTGLRLPDGSTLAVVRGQVPGSVADAPEPPTGVVTQTGVLLPAEPNPDSTDPNKLSSVRVQLLAQTWPGPMIDGYVLLSAEDSAAQGLQPAAWLPPTSGGRLRNGAYAAQWWIFGIFVLVMAAKMARDIGETSDESRIIS